MSSRQRLLPLVVLGLSLLVLGLALLVLLTSTPPPTGQPPESHQTLKTPGKP